MYTRLVKHRAKHSLGLDLSRFTFFVLKYEWTLGPVTLHPVLRVAAWSLNAARHVL